MAGPTSIEWTDKTWNPSSGCSKVSPGCKNCYAERTAHRLQDMGVPKYDAGFEYREWDDESPLKWKKPCRIFVNSMSDFFHERATWYHQRHCMDIMRRCPQHQFQILTKREVAMSEFVMRWRETDSPDWPPNVWLGVSCEDGDPRRLERVRTLANIPGIRIRFVSFEPLIGHISGRDLINSDIGKIQWAIVGGESGPGHRPMHKDWAMEIKNTCALHQVPFFFKQWGGARPKSGGDLLEGRQYHEFPDTGSPLVEVL